MRCATQISRALRAQADIELRMGVHSGLVHRIADINTNMNVAGGGINIAQRVMDCGDSGHILVSQRVADDLGQLERWSKYLHDLGVTRVKHGLPLSVSNLFGEDFGNPHVPQKFAAAAPAPFFKRVPVVAGMSLAILALAVAGAWYKLKSNRLTNPPPVNPSPVLGPEQSLSYWLTVQKMLGGKPLGKPIESTGNIIFGNGWKFRFNVRPAQSGALYLLNVGPGKTGAAEYNILFPLPQKGQMNSRLSANQTMQSDWYQFVEHTGKEELWIIWSTQPIPELDAIFSQAAASHQSPGVVADPSQIALVETYLKKYDSTPPEKIDDVTRNLTALKGRGNIVVARVQLQHEEV